MIPMFLLTGIVAYSNPSGGDHLGEFAGPFNDGNELVHQSKKNIIEMSPEAMKVEEIKNEKKVS